MNIFKLSFFLFFLFVSVSFGNSPYIDMKNNKFNYNTNLIDPFGSFEIGVILSRGYFLSYSWIGSPKKQTLLNGFYILSEVDENIRNYEDYTSVFGTINVFDDRYDGTVWENIYYSVGLLGSKNILNNEIIFLLGISKSETSYYEAYYDNLEILGNNGLYYINSSNSPDHSYGITYGVKYNIYPFKVQYIRNVEFYFGVGLIGDTNSMNNYIMPVITFGGIGGL